MWLLASESKAHKADSERFSKACLLTVKEILKQFHILRAARPELIMRGLLSLPQGATKHTVGGLFT